MRGEHPGHVAIERDGRVLVITFDRPARKNALTGAMYEAATRALRDADRDESVGAVVFRGAGGCFTAGNDLADFLAVRGTAAELPAFAFIKALALCETPMVAAVEGVAVGIGATLILHCDLVYVSPGTMFRMPFVDLGLVPEAASSLLLPRRIGLAKASELLLLGETLGADEALRLGLANDIIAAGKLRAYAIAQAERLAAKPRAALAATRRLIRGDRESVLARIEEEARCFAEALGSDVARAAFRSFLGKK
jgi:enoyl-CoA hydratase/carnithine racemase